MQNMIIDFLFKKNKMDGNTEIIYNMALFKMRD